MVPTVILYGTVAYPEIKGRGDPIFENSLDATLPWESGGGDSIKNEYKWCYFVLK